MLMGLRKELLRSGMRNYRREFRSFCWMMSRGVMGDGHFFVVFFFLHTRV